ncbi:MAG: bestrophin family ion channel [Planctomycetales bacterium]
MFTRVSWVAWLLAFYTLGVCLLDSYVIGHLTSLRASMHTLLGMVLGILLVFRTNTAYDRWWEGRKLWGQLVNDSRNLAIKIQACVQASETEKQLLGVKLIAFSCGLRDHLRGKARLNALPGFEDSTVHPHHIPSFVAKSIYETIENWRQTEKVGGFELLFLDRHAAALMDICGGCERILKTPIARSYRTFIRETIGVYLFTLPWGLVEDYGYWSVPLVLLLSYFMVGIELIAEDIEQPFGTGYDDLHLDEYCRTIETNVTELIRLDQPPRAA